MKLIPIAKPVKFTIASGGEDHYNLSTLRKNFNVDELIAIFDDRILRWLKQQGISETDKIYADVKSLLDNGIQSSDSKDFESQLKVIKALFSDTSMDDVNDVIQLLEYWSQKGYEDNIDLFIGKLSRKELKLAVKSESSYLSERAKKILSVFEKNRGNVEKALELDDACDLQFPGYNSNWKKKDKSDFIELLKTYKRGDYIYYSNYSDLVKPSAGFVGFVQELKRNAINVSTLITYLYNCEAISREWPDFQSTFIIFIFISIRRFIGFAGFDHFSRQISRYKVKVSALVRIVLLNEMSNEHLLDDFSVESQSVLQSIAPADCGAFINALDYLIDSYKNNAI